MTTTEEDIRHREAYIGRVFDKLSSMFIRKDKKGIENSALHHIDMILQHKEEISTVIDVGSGAGGLMISLLEEGFDCIIGVDLSSKLSHEARDRINTLGLSERAKVIEGSFLSLKEESTDAISMHASMCCYPDSDAMLNKSVSLTPKVITITIPRDRLIFRFGLGIIKIFQLMKFFHIHRIKDIDYKLLSSNYELSNIKNSFVWTTRTYLEKKQN
ncbi:MAG: class I SAM-dependent methyltransferase [Candidatus Hodarchaeales archaeon]|jgi:hypothetical protein